MDKILSIIVPSYNMEAYLPKCLGSLVINDKELLRQVDVIVVNDGSRDRTSEIAHSFEAEYPDVFRVIDKSNGNYGSCVNAALARAQGHFVRILDADDSFDTLAFERYLHFLLEQANGLNPDVVFNDFDMVNPDGGALRHFSYELTGKKDFSLAEFDYGNSKPTVWIHALAYRTSMLKDIHYCQSEGVFYSDQEWDMIPMLHVRKISYCPETVCKYLVGRADQSCNENVKLNNYSMHLSVAMKIIGKYVESKGIVPKANLAVVENQIKSHIRAFYLDYLIQCHRVLDSSQLIPYDEFLKGADVGLYDYSTHLLAPRTNFQYVKEWRRAGFSRQTVRFWLFDLYYHLRCHLASFKTMARLYRRMLHHGEFARKEGLLSSD